MIEERDKRAGDSRIILYRSVKQIILIVLIAIILKVFFIDTTRIDGNQMSPTLVKGDQVLIFRLPYIPVLRNIFPFSIAKPVIFNYPFEKDKLTCLRIAAESSNTISIDSGKVINSRSKNFSYPTVGRDGILVPPNFGPRDFFAPYTIPRKGDHLHIDTLPLRDFFFAAAIIRQENPKSKIELKPELYIDDSLRNDYLISNFSLYSGTIDTLPQKFQFDWFFWDRLSQFLNASMEDRLATFKFSLYENGKRVGIYKVRKNYTFLLADNWNNGLDSRYIGPVQRSAILGNVTMVLWSYSTDTEKHFKTNRLGRIIK